MNRSVVLKLAFLLILWPSVTYADDSQMYTPDGYYPPDRSSQEETYAQYIELGKFALEAEDYEGALRFFQYAQKFNPRSEIPARYINIIKRKMEQRVQPLTPQGKQRPARIKKAVEKKPTVKPATKTSKPTVKPAAKPVKKITVKQKAEPLPPETEVPAQVFLGKKKKSVTPPPEESQAILVTEKEIELTDELWATQPGTVLRIELDSYLILKGHNIERSLAITPGFIETEQIDRDQLIIKPLKRGATFLHVWEEGRRWTFNVEVILPIKITQVRPAQEIGPLRYAEPFRFSYSADWSSFYLGPSMDSLERQNLNYIQRYSMYGETPYGDADAFGVSNKFEESTEVISYGVGLTDGQIGNFRDFNVRGFDTRKEFSPLTLPGEYFRGILFESKAFNRMIDYKYVHGRDRTSFGFLSTGTIERRESYIEGFKVTAFPDNDDQVSFNYVRGYGDARPAYLKDEVYSLQAQKRLKEVLISGETAYDNEDRAHLVSSKFGSGNFSGGLNLRDIEKGFTTITNLPANQGEAGGNLFLNWFLEAVDIDTNLDLYRDNLFPNPDNPRALNRDFSSSVNLRVSPTDQWRTSFFYIDTPGEISPRQNIRAMSNYSKRFRLTDVKDLTTTLGVGYQRSRFDRVASSDYDRYSVNAGLRLPLMTDLSYYANYEYSFLDEAATDEILNPNVFTTGVSYFRQLTKSLAGTTGFSYRNEEDTEGVNSFLAGEDSIAGNVGLTYSPTNDFEIFLDGRVRNVWKESNQNTAFNEVDVRAGLRSLWDLPFAWNPSGVVSGYVFKDLNGNKKRDPDEPGLADVVVNVGYDQTPTDSRGHYRQAIRAKQAQVFIDANDVPRGFIFSSASLKEVDIVKDKTPRVDFGLTTQSGIYGAVFYDANKNGKPDAQEVFVPRVEIILDGQLTASSDAQGTYFFNNAAPGKHTLTINIHSIPLEYLPAVKIKNKIDLTEGTTYIFHVPLHKNPRPLE